MQGGNFGGADFSGANFGGADLGSDAAPAENESDSDEDGPPPLEAAEPAK